MRQSQKEYGWGILDTSCNKFIGIDTDSGGYPVEVKEAYRIHIFPSQAQAESYKYIFINSISTAPTASKWEVKRIWRGIEILED